VMLGVGLAAAAGLAALVVGGPKPAPEAASGPVVTAVATATVATIEPGTLIVETSPVGALTIDGVAIGTTPHRGALKPGRHVVRIQAEGHRAWRSRIDLQPGEARRLEVTLEPEPSRPRVASPPAITVGHR
ncbi:MAG: PEGA domain-containing protein, partial [Deltaproteobacteria bacterium]|nr:PEGA domain-containing protein [Deltaproteobacteria bacterium]